MRTHLLRTFYPSPEIELDADRASNDDCYASDVNSVVADAETGLKAPDTETNPLLDEYVLGGYAGI
jgi:hypothetical protein